MAKVDLTGQRFGMLVVTGVCKEKSGKNTPYWHYVGAAAAERTRYSPMATRS